MTMDNVRYLYKGVEVDERTREYIEKRISGLDKVVENILQTEVEIEIDKKGKFRVEVMVKTPHDLFRADNTTDSIEASVDMTADELFDQMTHIKDKLNTLRERGARSIKKKMVVDGDARF